MNWAWATSLDQIWRSPAFPMWLTLAAAGFFGIIALITLLRAEKSVANGALTVITLLAVGIAVAATLRGFGPLGGASAGAQSAPSISASLPALSCIDDLAGEMVLTACEKPLFGSPESAAAAVSRAGSMITRLTALGDVATADQNMTTELQALRRAVERDRYGLMAYVLAARDHCSSSRCPVFAFLTDHHQIAANMDERSYEGLIMRYAPSWNAPASAGAMAAIASPGATGKPTNADFPTAASTPPVSIMTPEPVIGTQRPPVASASAPQPQARPTTTATSTSPPAAAKKKPARVAAPTPLQPSAPVTAAAPTNVN